MHCDALHYYTSNRFGLSSVQCRIVSFEQINMQTEANYSALHTSSTHFNRDLHISFRKMNKFVRGEFTTTEVHKELKIFNLNTTREIAAELIR